MLRSLLEEQGGGRKQAERREKPAPSAAATKKGRLSDKLSRKCFKEDKTNPRSLDRRNVRFKMLVKAL